MRRTMLLAMMAAMVLVASAPALAQSGEAQDQIDDTAILTFEVDTTGEIPEDTTFFAGYAGAEFGLTTLQLTDPDGGGTIRLTEAQFTSLIAEPVRQSDAGLFLEDLTVWFEPETVYLRARSKGGQLPIKGEVVMSGGLAVSNGKLTLSVDQARTASVGVPDAALKVLNGELTRRIRLLDALDMPVRSLRVESGAVVIEPA